MSRESVASVLKKKRKESGLDVESVVSILHEQYEIKISVKTLYSYESGHRQPDADTLLALCEIYEIEDILSAFGYKKEEPTIENDDQLTMPEAMFMSLPDNLRQDALRYMRYLVEQEGKRK